MIIIRLMFFAKTNIKTACRVDTLFLTILLQSEKLFLFFVVFFFGDGAAVEEVFVLFDLIGGVFGGSGCGRGCRCCGGCFADFVELILHEDRRDDAEEDCENERKRCAVACEVFGLCQCIDALCRLVYPVQVVEGNKHAEQQLGCGIALLGTGGAVQRLGGLVDPHILPNAADQEHQKHMMHHVDVAVLGGSGRIVCCSVCIGVCRCTRCRIAREPLSDKGNDDDKEDQGNCQDQRLGLLDDTVANKVRYVDDLQDQRNDPELCGAGVRSAAVRKDREHEQKSHGSKVDQREQYGDQNTRVCCVDESKQILDHIYKAVEHIGAEHDRVSDIRLFEKQQDAEYDDAEVCDR